MLRSLHLLLAACCAPFALAQPGWRPLTVRFTLLYHNELVSPVDLQREKDFTIRMQGREADLGRLPDTTSSQAWFDPVESDISTHHDTLWMVITHGKEHMRIGFPPRTSRQGVRYTTGLLRIDFKAGTCMVTDLPKRLDLRGTIGNIAVIRESMLYSALYIRSSKQWWRSISADLTTGRFDGSLDCNTIMIAGDEWVDVDVVAANIGWHQERVMTIRMPYRPAVDLDTIPWIPSRFRLKQQQLRIETALPRDTVIGEPASGVALHMDPVNPTPQDTLMIEVEWNSSGAPYVSSHTLVARPDGITESRIAFALRTDVDIYGESWTQRARPFVLPPLPAGRYVLKQDVLSADHLLNVDLLGGREVPFTVGSRYEP